MYNPLSHLYGGLFALCCVTLRLLPHTRKGVVCHVSVLCVLHACVVYRIILRHKAHTADDVSMYDTRTAFHYIRCGVLDIRKEQGYKYSKSKYIDYA